MVPSELIKEGSIGGLLVFLGCWSKGPYSVPDQQGDIFRFRSYLVTDIGIVGHLSPKANY